MFTVSIRIPFQVLGTNQYVNASLIYHEALPKGKVISVVAASEALDKAHVSGYSGFIKAEVIESVKTTRNPDSFLWRIF